MSTSDSEDGFHPETLRRYAVDTLNSSLGGDYFSYSESSTSTESSTSRSVTPVKPSKERMKEIDRGALMTDEEYSMEVYVSIKIKHLFISS